MVEQLLEQALVCGSEPTWEHGEGEAVAKRQPARASGYEVTMSMWGRQHGVVEASLSEKYQAPYLARQMSKQFCYTSTGVAT
jgi:hypothetical protein